MSSRARGHAVPVEGGRFLIVGGGSLVGYHTSLELLRRGAREVVIFDNFSFGPNDDARELAETGRVRTVRGDVMRISDLLEATRGVDGVIALAALMTLSIAEDPWAGIDVNIRGVQNLLAACRHNDVAKVVFASSNAVYGYGPGVVGNIPESSPFHSDGAPPAGVIYGATKIIGEQLCRMAYQASGVDYVVVRYSTVYGERQHQRAANALFIMDALDSIDEGKSPVIVGDGQDCKHYVYVGDLARANALALESAVTDVAVNCSGPEPVTTGELVRIISELTGHVGEPVYQDPPPGVVRLSAGGEFAYDHSLAEHLIGWRPEVDLREGIGRLIAWRKSRTGSPGS